MFLYNNTNLRGLKNLLGLIGYEKAASTEQRRDGGLKCETSSFQGFHPLISLPMEIGRGFKPLINHNQKKLSYNPHSPAQNRLYLFSDVLVY